MTAVRIGPQPMPEHAPACLCQRLFGLTLGPFPGVMKYSGKRDQYLVMCPNCHWRTSAFGNWQAALAAWCGSNRAGEAHIEKMWLEEYEQQGGRYQAAS